MYGVCSWDAFMPSNSAGSLAKGPTTTRRNDGCAKGQGRHSFPGITADTCFAVEGEFARAPRGDEETPSRVRGRDAAYRGKCGADIDMCASSLRSAREVFSARFWRPDAIYHLRGVYLSVTVCCWAAAKGWPLSDRIRLAFAVHGWSGATTPHDQQCLVASVSSCSPESVRIFTLTCLCNQGAKN